ncbi:PIF-like protein, partial [Striga asiatica]
MSSGSTFSFAGSFAVEAGSAQRKHQQHVGELAREKKTEKKGYLVIFISFPYFAMNCAGLCCVHEVAFEGAKCMSTSEAGPSQIKQGEAKGPPENEARFISLMLDQVILGKCIGQKFKQCNWMEIQEKLNDICGPEYYYEITQITSKHDRLKQHWHRFYNMVNKDTGFRWESSTGKITGGDELWAQWITISALVPFIVQ